MNYINTVQFGDCRESMRKMIDAGVKVQCCVTSPPYYGLRDYGVDGQIGLEQTPEQYIANLVEVFSLVWELLNDDGVLWVNIGSSYATKPIESSEYVIRNDITNEEYEYVAEIIAEKLSPMRRANAQAEQDMQSMSSKEDRESRELPHSDMQEMQKTVHCTQISSREGAGYILQHSMRKIRKSNQKETTSSSDMYNMRDEVREIQKQPKEECNQQELLQSGLLVQAQHIDEPQPMDRRATRKDESRSDAMEKESFGEGQMVLSSLSHTKESGSSSHSSVLHTQREKIGGIEWVDVMPHMPCEIQKQGNGLYRDNDIHCLNTSSRIEIKLKKEFIPISILKYFKPSYVIKQKDDIGIPAMLAFALRADGWYLRSDIIWNKKNPMPESVTDRPSKAHEYIFLLSKKPTYYYDHESIKEPVAESTIGRGKVSFGGSKGRDYKENIDKNDPNYRNGSEQWGRVFDYTESCNNGRNKRSVWTIANKPYPGSHFAVFPEELITPCILAGSRLGDTVLDPFFGSGTTGAVALKYGRNYIGCDLNRDYEPLQKERLKVQTELFGVVA